MALLETLANREWLCLSITSASCSSSYEEEEKLKEMHNWKHESEGSISSLGAHHDREKKRLSQLRKSEIALEIARGSTEENWLSLSIPGSSSSSYQGEKIKSKDKWLTLSVPGFSSYEEGEHKLKKRRHNHASTSNIGSSSSMISLAEGKQRTSAYEKSMTPLDITGGSSKNSNLSITKSSASREEEEEHRPFNKPSSRKMTPRIGQSSSSQENKEEEEEREEHHRRLLYHKKGKKKMDDMPEEGNHSGNSMYHHRHKKFSSVKVKSRFTQSSSSPENKEEEEERHQMLLYHKKGKQKMDGMPEVEYNMHHGPNKKFPSSRKEERGWMETAFCMGVTHPELYLSKRVTQSDTKPNQHRFQLTQADIRNSTRPLQDLAEQATKSGITVKILDRKGNNYDMTFKYLESSHTYRFMGADYTEFLASSELKPNQIMDIWGLPGGNSEENWLAFINSDEKIMESTKGEGEGGEQRTEV